MGITSVTPYASLEEANAINLGASPWTGTSDDAKNIALINAKLYLDQNYSCQIPDTTPENLKEANSILANEDLTTSVFARQDDLGKIKEKSVGAGSAKVKTVFAVSDGGTWQDPFELVTALISDICSLSRFSSKVIRN